MMPAMPTSRLEAFSDGVIAILITVMVLSLGVPQGTDLAALGRLAPNLATYVLSFVVLGIYWNNRHHLLQAARRIDGRVLWANLHLLFRLSLIPFCAAWIGQTALAATPMAIYGLVLLMSALAYFLLVRSLIRVEGTGSVIATALGRDIKGIASPILYLAAIPIALVAPLGAFAVYILVALIWFVPDLRIERQLGQPATEAGDARGADPRAPDA